MSLDMAYTDRFYHGAHKKRSYFEGWYFKHRAGDEVFSVIPGMAVDRAGRRSAFLQIISRQGSRYLPYPPDAFSADPGRRLIRVGGSEFSLSGVKLNVREGDIDIRGEITYSPPTVLRRSLYAPGIMGPFSYLPLMECYHEVLSLHHRLTGTLSFGGRILDFTGGAGYLEKDYGRSFPKSWLWYQSGGFSRDGDCVMLALARIPFLGTAFPGILCVCFLGGKEYRLATYYGARLAALREAPGQVTAEIVQGDLQLRAEIFYENGNELLAPLFGDMSRAIVEHPGCTSRVTLQKGEKLLFQEEGSAAGFEQVGNPAEI